MRGIDSKWWGCLLLASGFGLVAPAAGHAQSAAAAARQPLPLDQLQVLAASWTVLQDSLVTPPDPKGLIVSAVKGMLHAADPEAGEYLTADEFAAWKSPRRTDQAAIGVEIRAKDGRFLLTPVEGSPATQAGVKFGDELHAIDGVHTRDMQHTEVFRRLSGPLGSKVTLTVFRESSLKVLEIPVERQAFLPPNPRVSRAAAGVVVLRISRFGADTLVQSVAELRQAWQAEPFKAVVLDLRGCPGGLLETSIGVAAIFLPENAVVAYARGAGKESNHTYYAAKAFYERRGRSDPLEDLPAAIRKLPLAVLVDGGTASGGEIVAAALQDHRRASVVGRTTYGRASIQTITPLSIGAMKYTSSYWTSPAGRNINGQGVTPDVLVEDPWSAATLQAAAQAAMGH